MSDSNLQYDALTIAKEILAHDICRNMVDFNKKQRRLDYAGLIILSVGLALLFALMLVVAGMKEMGVFTAIIKKLVAKVKTTRVIELILVFVPFFAGMIITNDVALITFVPFAIELLQVIGRANV